MAEVDKKEQAPKGPKNKRVHFDPNPPKVIEISPHNKGVKANIRKFQLPITDNTMLKNLIWQMLPYETTFGGVDDPSIYDTPPFFRSNSNCIVRMLKSIKFFYRRNILFRK